MSKIKPVTSAQGGSLVKMANAKGIPRDAFQTWLDNHAAGTLDDIKTGTVGLKAPDGARIHIVRIKYRQDRAWAEAIDAAGLNTPADYNVRKVGDLYLPTGTQEIEEDLVMLNYHEGGGSWDKALAWASGAKLENTVPREVFAVGEQHPKLHVTLGVNPMYAVATTPCSFEGYRQACYVWWDVSDRMAHLFWTSDFGYTYVWFLFRK